MSGFIYLVVGVDQDGDADWDVVSNLVQANKVADQKQETAFERPSIYKIDVATCTAVDA